MGGIGSKYDSQAKLGQYKYVTQRKDFLLLQCKSRQCVKMLILLAFFLAGNTVYSRTYYVKNGANGDGSSWNNASGVIQDMIDKAQLGDEVWIGKGTYYPSKKDYDYDYIEDSRKSFFMKDGVSIYGGFEGGENNKDERKIRDRDNDGTIDVWEFANETILSGDNDAIPDRWIWDEQNQKYIVTGNENNSNTVVNLGDKTEKEYLNTTIISSVTITGGNAYNGYKNGGGVVLFNNMILEKCEVKQNVATYSGGGVYGNGIVRHCNVHKNKNISTYGGAIDLTNGMIENSIAHQNEGIGITSYDGDLLIRKCEIYNNIGGGVSGAKEMSDCQIYNNINEWTHGGVVSGVSIVKRCNIYDNIGKSDGGGVSSGTFYNCEIYNNRSQKNGGGALSSVLYDCNIYNNNAQIDGGGVYGSTLYNCNIYSNYAEQDGGGAYRSTLYNCNVHSNYAQRDGGGISGGHTEQCRIYNNEAGNKGGGVYEGYIYTSNIYNNKANSYAGAYSNHGTSCTISHNISLDNTDNKGYFCNFILTGSGSSEVAGTYLALTDSYIQGEGNFLTTEKEIKFVKAPSFKGLAQTAAQLEELKNGDFRLLAGSSCIDVGGGETPVRDMDGLPRPMGTKKDVGAHEFIVTTSLPYANDFNESSSSIEANGYWVKGTLPGKNKPYIAFKGENYSDQNSEQSIITPLFEKVLSNRATFSYTLSAKFVNANMKEKLYVVMAYSDSKQIDTLAVYTNQSTVMENSVSHEIAGYCKNRNFYVLFIVEGDNPQDIIYWGITDLKVNKRDSEIEIIAEDNTVIYDGTPQKVNYQINDNRVDKSKAKVTYLLGEETVDRPIDAGVYTAIITIEDGSYYGASEVTLTINKAFQNIVWDQLISDLSQPSETPLKAKASSGLAVEYRSSAEEVAQIEKRDNTWVLVAKKAGEARITAAQSGNNNYNPAQSAIKTVTVKGGTTGIELPSVAKINVYPQPFTDYLIVENILPGDHIYLFDSLGHKYIEVAASEHFERINIPAVGKGIYFLVVQRNGIRITSITLIK